jgi:hypothetical protein
VSNLLISTVVTEVTVGRLSVSGRRLVFYLKPELRLGFFVISSIFIRGVVFKKILFGWRLYFGE